MYANYEQVEKSLANLRPFEGNSCRAVSDYDSFEYRVFSYGTLIATFSLRDGRATLNARKYSQTTSRLQNIIRKAWANESVTEYN